MTLPLPNLDDRTYTDLVADARSHIPLECPDWTDHNPSDPGIAVIELLAWLTELALYRVNQIPVQNTAAFLSLLAGTDVDPPASPAALQQTLRQTLSDLRQTYRAVTPADFAALVQQWNQAQTDPTLRIRRSHCLPGRNLARPTAPPDGPGDESAHVSLVVLPDGGTEPQPSPALVDQLHKWLEPRQLLTVHHHVVGPQYVALQPGARLFLEAGANPATVRTQALAEVEAFFHPLASGRYWGGGGWPFGRSAHRSELYALLDGIAGVDYVEDVQLEAGAAPRQAIAIAPHALVSARLSPNRFILMEPTGNEWQPL